MWPQESCQKNLRFVSNDRFSESGSRDFIAEM